MDKISVVIESPRIYYKFNWINIFRQQNYCELFTKTTQLQKHTLVLESKEIVQTHNGTFLTVITELTGDISILGKSLHNFFIFQFRAFLKSCLTNSGFYFTSLPFRHSSHLNFFKNI